MLVCVRTQVIDIKTVFKEVPSNPGPACKSDCSSTYQKLKATKVPSIGEWLNKLHVCTTEYYSDIKRKKSPNHKKTWVNLKCILLSEKSQSKRSTYPLIPIICHSRKGKNIETKKYQWYPGAGSRVEKVNHRGFLGQWNNSVWNCNGQ